jgi:B12-binding domain/radical SAM domain protein
MYTPKVYNYGGLLIAGIIEKIGRRVIISKDWKDIVKLLPKIDVLCLSLQSTSQLFEIANPLQFKKEKDLFIIAGGPAVQDPEFAFNVVPELDVIVLGEGEETIVDLLNCQRLSEVENIFGIAFKNGDEIVIKPIRKKTSLSNRPFIKVPPDLKSQHVRGVNMYIEVLRGCPGKCSFCQYCWMFGHSIRSRPLHEILGEVTYLKTHGIQKIAISGGDVSYYGASFSKHKQESLEDLLENLCEILGRNNLAGLDVRIDSLNSDILESIKKYTQGWIFLGIESGSDRILRMINKGINVNQIFKGVELAKKEKIKISGSFMTGFIFETYEDFLSTKELISELELDHYSICITEPVPQTPYWNFVKMIPLSENPLFKKSTGENVARKNLTVAEHQALVLEETAYKRLYNKPMSNYIRKNRIAIIKRECKRIRKIVRKLVSLNRS